MLAPANARKPRDLRGPGAFVAAADPGGARYASRRAAGRRRKAQRPLFRESLSSLPILKRTFLLALMVIVAPVAGLRPLRAARLETLKLPKPGTCTRSPFLSAFEIASIAASNASPAAFLVSPSTESAMCSTMSALLAILPPVRNGSRLELRRGL